MTRRLRGVCFRGFQFGQVLPWVFIKRFDATFAAKPNQAVSIQGVDRVAHAAQLIPGNQAGFQGVGRDLGFGLSFFLRGLDEDGLQGRGLSLCVCGEGQTCGPTD